MKEESPIDKYQYVIHHMTKGSPELIFGYAISKGWRPSRTSQLPRWIFKHPNSGELIEIIIPKIAGWGGHWNIYVRKIAEGMAQVEKTSLRDIDCQFQAWVNKERQEAMTREVSNLREKGEETMVSKEEAVREIKEVMDDLEAGSYVYGILKEKYRELRSEKQGILDDFEDECGFSISYDKPRRKIHVVNTRDPDILENHFEPDEFRAFIGVLSDILAEADANEARIARLLTEMTER